MNVNINSHASIKSGWLMIVSKVRYVVLLVSVETSVDDWLLIKRNWIRIVILLLKKSVNMLIFLLRDRLPLELNKLIWLLKLWSSFRTLLNVIRILLLLRLLLLLSALFKELRQDILSLRTKLIRMLSRLLFRKLEIRLMIKVLLQVELLIPFLVLFLNLQ